MTVVLLLVIRAITPGRILGALFGVFCWYFHIHRAALIVAERMVIGDAVAVMVIYALLPKSWRERVAAVVKPLLKLVYVVVVALINGMLRCLRGRGEK